MQNNSFLAMLCALIVFHAARSAFSLTIWQPLLRRRESQAEVADYPLPSIEPGPSGIADLSRLVDRVERALTDSYEAQEAQERVIKKEGLRFVVRLADEITYLRHAVQALQASSTAQDASATAVTAATAATSGESP